MGAPQHILVVLSFDHAKHRNQNQFFEDSSAETPRFLERPSYRVLPPPRRWWWKELGVHPLRTGRPALGQAQTDKKALQSSTFWQQQARAHTRLYTIKRYICLFAQILHIFSQTESADKKEKSLAGSFCLACVIHALAEIASDWNKTQKRYRNEVFFNFTG